MKKRETITDSLKEVLMDLNGQKRLPSRSVTLDDLDICKIREKYKMSQSEFSEVFGFNLRTLQHWEQGRRNPQGAVKILLKVIDYAPEVVEKAIRH